MLRKGTIKKNNLGKYLVEDLFNGGIINMKLFGKQKMHFPNSEIGEEVYVNCSLPESKNGRLITGTEIKMDETNVLYGEKVDLDLKQKALE